MTSSTTRSSRPTRQHDVGSRDGDRSERERSDCTPANGSSLAPGASMTCTATHTVTQADIDAGHYANTACVDDGAGGAAEACDDEDVRGDQNPALTITKVATESELRRGRRRIHYTIVATNDGNTTLAAVTVTDPHASDLSCTPANGSPLAPGASMTCTASHTVTQADIDAGTTSTRPASTTVPVGPRGLRRRTTPGVTRTRSCRSRRRRREASYDEVGDVIHYTIVATNTATRRWRR